MSSTTSTVTVISDVIAVIIMLIIYPTARASYGGHTENASSAGGGKKQFEGKIFLSFIYLVILTAVFEGMSYAFSYMITESSDMISATAHIAREISSTLVYFTWLIYVNYRLYHKKDYIKRNLFIYLIPLALCFAATIGADVATVLSDLSDEYGVYAVIFLFIFHFVRFFYFVASVVVIRRFKKQNGHLTFFRPELFYIPILICVLGTLFTPFSIEAFMFSISIALFYIASERENRYIDAETGLYTDDYIECMEQLIKKGELSPCSAVVFKINDIEDIKSFSGILGGMLPENCEMIRRGKDEVIVFTPLDNRGPVLLLMDDVCTDTGASGRVVMRQKDETGSEFVKRCQDM